MMVKAQIHKYCRTEAISEYCHMDYEVPTKADPRHRTFGEEPFYAQLVHF